MKRSRGSSREDNEMGGEKWVSVGKKTAVACCRFLSVAPPGEQLLAASNKKGI